MLNKNELKEIVSEAYYYLFDVLGYAEMDTVEFANDARLVYRAFTTEFEKSDSADISVAKVSMLLKNGSMFHRVAKQVGGLERFKDLQKRLAKLT